MKWYYEKDERQQGPVELAELQEMLRSGVVKSDALVWHEEMSDWTPAAKVKELHVAKQESVAYGEAPALGLPKTEYGAAPEVFREEEKVQKVSPVFAIISLVCGILSVVASCVPYLGIVLAVVALVMGYIHGSRGSGKASTGKLLGWLGLLLSLIILGVQIYLQKHPEMLENLIKQTQTTR